MVTDEFESSRSDNGSRNAPSIRDWVGIGQSGVLGMIASAEIRNIHLSKPLPEIVVAPDAYEVSPEPVILVANLSGALALCLHDEGRGVGGLLHLRYTSGDGRPSDVTDNTLSSVLVVLDRFKKAVLGNSFRPDEVPPPARRSRRTAALRAAGSTGREQPQRPRARRAPRSCATHPARPAHAPPAG